MGLHIIILYPDTGWGEASWLDADGTMVINSFRMSNPFQISDPYDPFAVIYHDAWTWRLPDVNQLYQEFLDALPRNSPYSPHFQELPSVFALWEDCEKLFEKYPQADRTPRDRFATMDDAALASYLYNLPDGRGTVWGHSVLIPKRGGPAAPYTEGKEWGSMGGVLPLQILEQATAGILPQT
jgi:hypothetical protein